MSSGFHCLVACMVEVQTVKLLNPISGLRLLSNWYAKKFCLQASKRVNITRQFNYLI